MTWFLFSLCHFHTHKCIFNQAPLSLPSPLRFQALSVQLLLFLHLLLCILFINPNSVFFFAQIERDENCHPSYRNLRIFLDCMFFSLYDITKRKPVWNLILSCVLKATFWNRIKSIESTSIYIERERWSKMFIQTLHLRTNLNF